MTDHVDMRAVAFAEVQIELQNKILAAIDETTASFLATASVMTGQDEKAAATRLKVKAAWASTFVSSFWDMVASQLRPDTPPDEVRALVLQLLAGGIREVCEWRASPAFEVARKGAVH